MARGVANCTCMYCGKKFQRIAFKHNRTEADDFVTWAEKNCTECNECYQKRIERERKEKAKAEKLPELKGSPKQIAWAESIRLKFWNEYKADEKNFTPDMITPEIKTIIENCRKVFMEITSAETYINNRKKDTFDFLNNIMNKKATNKD